FRDVDLSIRSHDFQPAAKWKSKAAVKRCHAAVGQGKNAVHFDIDPVLHFRSCHRPRRLGAERPANAVDGVAAHIEQTASAQLGFEADVIGVEGFHLKREGATNSADLSNLAGIEKAP